MKRAANQPTGELTLYAGIFCKVWRIPDAGTLVPQHAHAHPHITLVVAGVVRVWQGDALLGEYRMGDMLRIPKRTKHSFLALCDGVMFACIHSVGAADDVMIAEDHALELEDL